MDAKPIYQLICQALDALLVNPHQQNFEIHHLLQEAFVVPDHQAKQKPLYLHFQAAFFFFLRHPCDLFLLMHELHECLSYSITKFAIHRPFLINLKNIDAKIKKVEKEEQNLARLVANDLEEMKLPFSSKKI